MNTTNFLLVVLIGLAVFAAIPKWISLLIGVVLGLLLKIYLPSKEDIIQWIS